MGELGCSGCVGRSPRRRGSAETPKEEAAVADAGLLLSSFGPVRSPSGVEGVLRPKEVGGGGWCFFSAFYAQLASERVPSFEYLAVLTLADMASRSAEFAPFLCCQDALGQEAPEVREARAFLSSVPAYSEFVGGFSPFECLVLDKFEGVLRGDLLDLRRYPDDNDIQVLLQLSSCDVLVMESNDVHRDGCLARSCVYPGRQLAGPGLLGRFRAGGVDMVLVRYELGSYLHYASVDFESGCSWRVAPSKRERLDRTYLTCEVCRAVRDGDDDVARMLMYTRLSGNTALGAVMTLG